MVNFKTEREGRWFYYDESNTGLGGVKLRTCSVDEENRIAKITTKKTKKFKRGQMVESVDQDIALAFNMQMDYCIVDWAGTAINKVPLDCNTENKKEALRSDQFSKFVIERLAILNDENTDIEAAKAEAEEARVKNLENTSDSA